MLGREHVADRLRRMAATGLQHQAEDVVAATAKWGRITDYEVYEATPGN